MKRRDLLSLLPWLAAGCASAPPDMHYYQLVVAREARPPQARGRGVLAIEPFEIDAAYDTERMVYRLSPYRLDYYHYHRWSAAPALHVRDFLRQAYARTGAFVDVVAGPTPETAAILGGRLIALEEVDATEQHWFARVSLELALRDARSEAALWSNLFDEREPMPQRNPEGLARASSIALERVVTKSTGSIAHAMASATALEP